MYITWKHQLNFRLTKLIWWIKGNYKPEQLTHIRRRCNSKLTTETLTLHSSEDSWIHPMKISMTPDLMCGWMCWSSTNKRAIGPAIALNELHVLHQVQVSSLENIIMLTLSRFDSFWSYMTFTIPSRQDRHFEVIPVTCVTFWPPKAKES